MKIQRIDSLLKNGKETVAMNIGLSYMQAELNKKLKQLHCEKRVEEYFFPKAFTCKTSFIDIMVRNLYFSENNKDWGLNPLDLAERLFLLEYITLMRESIDPENLIDYT